MSQVVLLTPVNKLLQKVKLLLHHKGYIMITGSIKIISVCLQLTFHLFSWGD